MTLFDLKWKFEKDAAGEWRWTAQSKNNRTVGASSEGFINRQDCIKNAKFFGYIENGDDVRTLWNEFTRIVKDQLCVFLKYRLQGL